MASCLNLEASEVMPVLEAPAQSLFLASCRSWSACRSAGQRQHSSFCLHICTFIATHMMSYAMTVLDIFYVGVCPTAAGAEEFFRYSSALGNSLADDDDIDAVAAAANCQTHGTDVQLSASMSLRHSQTDAMLCRRTRLTILSSPPCNEGFCFQHII